MPDQTTISTVDNQDVLMELAAEVTIPISECVISLSAPADCFKEDATRKQALANLQGALQANSIQLEQQKSLPFALFAPNLPQAVGLAQLQGIRAGLSAEATRFATPLRPQLFLIETYRLTTQRTGKGKGPAVSSLNLLPGEQKTFEIRTAFTQTKDVTETTTVMESEDSTVAQAFNDHVAGSSSKSGSTDASDYHLNANFHGDASIGIGSGEVNAALNVQGGSNEVRSDFSNAVQNAVDRQIGQTSASRKQSVSEQKSATQTTEQTATVSTDSITNPNPTHAVTVFWFQLLERYTSFLSLVNVEVAFKTTDASLNQQVPLHDLDKLLTGVVVAAKVDEVRAAIRNELATILDYQDQVRNMAEEVPLGSGNTFIRLKPGLQSTFVLKDGNGNPIRNINVDGVLVKVISRIIPSRLLVTDLVVGATSAV